MSRSSKLNVLIAEHDTIPPECLERINANANVRLLPKGAELCAHLKDTHVLITKLAFHIGKNLIDSAPELKAVATPTTGLNHIDQDTAKARGVEIISLRGETDFLNSVTATAEHNWGLLLALIRNIPQAHQAVVSGEWERNDFHGVELSNKVLGIIGLGRLGLMTASYGQAFRMKVFGCDPYTKNTPSFIFKTTIEDVFERSDAICIHLPYNENTNQLIGATLLSRCKKGCLLTNTARGEVLDEEALLASLRSGQIAGAAVDVICGETPKQPGFPASNKLVNYAAKNSNVIITPHIGGATTDSLHKAETYLTDLVIRFVKSIQ